ncbi:MAG: homocysteine S-methyltransferase family protein [Proteobacteria bacterium]|nr:homocysteine S-methyltransferase family protein [Pseudomonadota bacterium]
MATWQEKLAADEIVLIDGGMGTELERVGAQMNANGWSGAAVIEVPDVVRRVHREFVEDGAEVITVNTFSMAPHMLAGMGYGDRVEQAIADSVRLAREACAEAGMPDLPLAGSVSTMRTKNVETGTWPALPPKEAQESLSTLVHILKEEGCSVMALEMMEDLEVAPVATGIAVASGLPTRLGISCRRAADGTTIESFDVPGVTLDQLYAALLPLGADVLNIMHSEIPVTGEALERARPLWNKPMGAYPESGYFTMPTWNFVDIVSPADLVEQARGWVARGARILGGCCGLGPDHIRALRDAMPQLMAARG